jgi:protein involved in polysaccharide export with SLBB domain
MRSIITFIVLVLVTAMWCIHSSRASTAPPAADKHVEPYIYVLGGVRAPGRYGWTNGMTVLDGINAAGGFTDSAGRRIKIVHIDGGADSFDRDIHDITNKPPMLKAGDSISVPKRIL